MSTQIPGQKDKIQSEWIMSLKKECVHHKLVEDMEK